MSPDILLYSTIKLYNYCESEHGDGYLALKRAKTYIEGAFNDVNFSPSVDYTTETVYAPQEEAHDVDTTYPCSNTAAYYSVLAGWFRDWINCKNKQEGNEVTLLISAANGASGGAMLNNSYGNAQTGKFAADVSQYYTAWGSGIPYNGMQTILHEIAHAYMNEPEEHRFGKIYDFNGDHRKSPMGKDSDYPNQNICGEDYVEHGTRYFDLEWSDCCIAAIEK